MTLSKALLSEPIFFPCRTGVHNVLSQILSHFMLKETCGPPPNGPGGCRGRPAFVQMRAQPKICFVGSKFLPSDFFQMDEYMNISRLFALAAFPQNQQLDIHLYH